MSAISSIWSMANPLSRARERRKRSGVRFGGSCKDGGDPFYRCWGRREDNAPIAGRTGRPAQQEPTQMSDIQSKVVALTGASSGIGEATARELARAGMKLVIGARRTDRLETLARAIRAEGGEVEFRALDVTRRENMAAFVAFAEERFGRLDVLINNAGVMPLSPLAALKTDEWDQMIDVNVRGVLNGVAAALPRFLAQGGGHFVNVASVAAHQVWPTCAVYSATKYAVWAITDGIRQEHNNDNIRATIISPGVVESELAGTITDPTTAAAIEQARTVALKPEVIARAIRYAVELPAEVGINEIVVRPMGGAF
jgi:NADP-dependent 3-hydroxy acid dehydrogenase YdfG